MYVTLAIVAGLIFFYSLVARGVEKTIVSGPMVFVVVGLLVGSHGFGWLGLLRHPRLVCSYSELDALLVGGTSSGICPQQSAVR